MGRKGRVDTWSFTYATPGDIDTLKPEVMDFFNGPNITWAYGIAERSSKWHIHIAFQTARKYNSDYKWWETMFTKWEMYHKDTNKHALEIHYHPDLAQLAGGYCAKADHKVIIRKGVTDDQLNLGARAYAENLKRSSLFKFLDTQRALPPAALDAAVGCYRVQYNCSRGEAILLLAKTGVMFSNSKVKELEGPIDDIYADTYRDFQKRVI